MAAIFLLTYLKTYLGFVNWRPEGEGLSEFQFLSLC